MNKKRFFTFKQLGFDNKPLDISLLPPAETVRDESPRSVRCRCWYCINEERMNYIETEKDQKRLLEVLRRLSPSLLIKYIRKLRDEN